jgi:hypothetical protein
MAAVNSNQAVALGSITKSTNDSSVDWQQSLDWFTFMYFVYTSTATLLFVVYFTKKLIKHYTTLPVDVTRIVSTAGYFMVEPGTNHYLN